MNWILDPDIITSGSHFKTSVICFKMNCPSCPFKLWATIITFENSFLGRMPYCTKSFKVFLHLKMCCFRPKVVHINYNTQDAMKSNIHFKMNSNKEEVEDSMSTNVQDTPPYPGLKWALLLRTKSTVISRTSTTAIPKTSTREWVAES